MPFKKVELSYNKLTQRVHIKFPDRTSYEHFVQFIGKSIKFDNNAHKSCRNKQWYLNDKDKMSLYLYAYHANGGNDDLVLKFPEESLREKFLGSFNFGDEYKTYANAPDCIYFPDDFKSNTNNFLSLIDFDNRTNEYFELLAIVVKQLAMKHSENKDYTSTITNNNHYSLTSTKRKLELTGATCEDNIYKIKMGKLVTEVHSSKTDQFESTPQTILNLDATFTYDANKHIVSILFTNGLMYELSLFEDIYKRSDQNEKPKSVDKAAISADIKALFESFTRGFLGVFNLNYNKKRRTIEHEHYSMEKIILEAFNGARVFMPSKSTNKYEFYDSYTNGALIDIFLADPIRYNAAFMNLMACQPHYTTEEEAAWSRKLWQAYYLQHLKKNDNEEQYDRVHGDITTEHNNIMEEISKTSLVDKTTIRRLFSNLGYHDPYLHESLLKDNDISRPRLLRARALYSVFKPTPLNTDDNQYAVSDDEQLNKLFEILKENGFPCKELKELAEFCEDNGCDFDGLCEEMGEELEDRDDTLLTISDDNSFREGCLEAAITEVSQQSQNACK